MRNNWVERERGREREREGGEREGGRERGGRERERERGEREGGRGSCFLWAWMAVESRVGEYTIEGDGLFGQSFFFRFTQIARGTSCTTVKVGPSRQQNSESETGFTLCKCSCIPVRQASLAKTRLLKRISSCLYLDRAQELCESRGGRPGLPSLIVLKVPVDVKHHLKNITHSCIGWVVVPEAQKCCVCVSKRPSYQRFPLFKLGVGQKVASHAWPYSRTFSKLIDC